LAAGLKAPPEYPLASRDALFRKALGRLGITDLHFHDARGEALTRMSRRVDILTLQKISGHIDIGQLAAYYKESPADIAKRL
jgi:integrase